MRRPQPASASPLGQKHRGAEQGCEDDPGAQRPEQPDKPPEGQQETVELGGGGGSQQEIQLGAGGQLWHARGQPRWPEYRQQNGTDDRGRAHQVQQPGIVVLLAVLLSCSRGTHLLVYSHPVRLTAYSEGRRAPSLQAE